MSSAMEKEGGGDGREAGASGAMREHAEVTRVLPLVWCTSEADARPAKAGVSA